MTKTSTTTDERIATIGEDGQLRYISDELLRDIFRELGPSSDRRASRIEPTNAALRAVHRLIRRWSGDDGRLTEWTRSWSCTWTATIVDGPTLGTAYRTRQAAIRAEVQYLSDHTESWERTNRGKDPDA